MTTTTKEMKEDGEHGPPPFVPFKYKYCRLCAWELQQGVLIFGEEGKRLKIPEKIRKTLAILVLEEDTLPKKICTDCCSSLEDYAQYKDTVLDAQEKLTSIAKCYPPPVFPSQQFHDAPHPSPHYSEDRKPNINSRNASSSSSTATLTCKECGKKFRVRSDFENHLSTAHPNYNYKPEYHHNFSRSTLPTSAMGHGDEDGSSPPSPISESSCHLTTVDLDLEDERRDSKAGIILIPMSTASIAASSSATPVATASKDKDGLTPFGPTPQILGKSVESSTNSLQCIYCDKILMSKTGLYNHLMTHKGRRFECKDCSCTYAQKGSLKAHVRTHHPQSTTTPLQPPPVPNPPSPRFSCPQCPSTFVRKSSLNAHKKSHLESRPFECTFCHKSYKTDKCLKKHLRYHTAADAFSCSFCNKTFCRKSKLEEHENVHIGRRPYGCNFCAKTFTSLPNYLKHVRRKHKDEVGQDGKVPSHLKIGVSEKSQPPNQPMVSTKNVTAQHQPKPATESHLSHASVQARVTPAAATASSSSFVQEKINTSISVPENGDMSYHCTNTTATMSAPPLSPSPSWVDLTGKQQQQHLSHSQQHSQIHNSDQPLAMNLNMSQSQNQNNHSSQQQIHHQYQHQQQQPHTHNHQAQQQAQHSHLQLSNHYQNQQHSLGNHSQQHQHQHQSQGPSSSQLPQGPSSTQQAQGQSTSQHQQQTYQNPNNYNQHQHTTAQGPPSGHNHQHQQHPQGHSSNQHQQPSSSQSHQLHVTTVSQPQPSSSTHTHSHQQQQNSHANLLQQHHLQYQVLGLSFQNPYNHHSQPLSLNSMDLMDCAIQSAVFGGDPHTPHNGGVNHSTSAPASTSASAPASVSVGPQNHPMELSYKLDNSNATASAAFQEMPMELTKVFQSGPLELCVRNDFNQLVDLTAKEPNFNERMSSIMDFRQQPMDLISRNEVCAGGSGQLGQSDNNNLVDLSLRSSFQDQSESSFLRDLIDLSSRSDYHGELNLSSRAHHISHAHKANSQQNVVYSDSMFGL